MATFHVEVRVMPRATLLDPQGQAVHHALTALGFAGVGAVSVGKAMTLSVEAPDAEAAAREVRAMCDRLLANPVTEDVAISVDGEL